MFNRVRYLTLEFLVNSSIRVYVYRPHFVLRMSWGLLDNQSESSCSMWLSDWLSSRFVWPNGMSEQLENRKLAVHDQPRPLLSDCFQAAKQAVNFVCSLAKVNLLCWTIDSASVNNSFRLTHEKCIRQWFLILFHNDASDSPLIKSVITYNTFQLFY